MAKFLCWLNDPLDNYDNIDNLKRYQIGGAQSISVFENKDIEKKYKDFLLSVEEVSDTTVNTYFRDYRVILYWMMANKYIKERKIEVKSQMPGVKDVYTETEINKLLKKPKEGCSFVEYRTWVIIHHLLATGNRISTICSIELADINWDEEMFVVKKQKNHKISYLPIEKAYFKVLKEYVYEWLTDENGEYISKYLFPSAYVESSEKMGRNTMGKSIAAYNKSRGVDKTSTHLFRHTFAKHWVMSGKDLHSLQKMLGHSTLEMVTHYANLYDTDLKKKVEESSILQDQKRHKRNSGKTMFRQKRKL
jgi:integrase/recombinase XerD